MESKIYILQSFRHRSGPHRWHQMFLKCIIIAAIYQKCWTSKHPPLILTTTRVVALDLALRPCHDATIPWALVGRALGPVMALVGPPGPLWTGPLWAPWALVGPPGPLWAGPLWARRALVGPPGPDRLALDAPHDRTQLTR